MAGVSPIAPDREDRLKMVCVFAMESVAKMKGSRGKLGAQAGHAFLHAWWDAIGRFPEAASDYKRSERAYKVCLRVETEEDLRKLEEAYRDRFGTSLVTDAGITVFDRPTTTCLGIGPIRDSECGDDLKALKVLT